MVECLSLAGLSRHDTQHNNIQQNDAQHKGLISHFQLNDTKHNNDTQHNNIAIMVNVIMRSVAMLNVVMLSVVAPFQDQPTICG
jgi:demethoxyubiquinone hydroxylase (CLK1/Coq7/Cat5 family)